MARRGRVYRRCTKCGRTASDGRRCDQCGGQVLWAYAIDVAAVGAKRRRVSGSGLATKQAATNALNEVLEESRSTVGYVEPSKLTLAAFVRERWLPAVRPTLRPTTFSSYAENLRLHALDPDGRLDHRLGDHRLEAIDPGALNALYGELLVSGRVDGSGGLSNSTVRYVATVLGRVFKDAERWGLIRRNPVPLSDPPRTRRRQTRVRAWSAATLATFLRGTTSYRLHPMWHLAAGTGLRRGELVALRWRDIDLEDRTLAVVRSTTSVRYKLHTGEPKTGQSIRRIALDDTTCTVLREWRVTQLEERVRWGAAWTDTGLVFTQEDGNGWHPDRISKLFDRAVAEVGVDRISLHGLRHTHATVGLEAGVPVKVMSERLGHANVGTTMSTYQHVIPGMDAEAAEMIANAVSTA